MKKLEFVVIAGYGWSGSGAVIDILKEFRNTIVPDLEFRIIKDPYGIMQLENSLVNEWDPITSAAAIRDFLWLCKKCEKPVKNRFSNFGLDYRNNLNENFLTITYKYLNSLTEFEYDANNYHLIFKKSYFQYISHKVINALLRKIDKLNSNFISKNNKLYFSKPTREEFYSATQKYIDELFNNISMDNDPCMVVLDQAVSPIHTRVLEDYFNSAKMIVVDRDPRDIYIDLMNNRGLIGSELAKNKDVLKYISWHKAIRSGLNESDKVLNIKFEDLLLNYSNTIKIICDFLNLKPHDHVSPKTIFNPDISIKNMRLWEKDKNNDHKEIKKICDELSEYLYEN